MEHTCPKCNTFMQEATLDHSGMFRVYKRNEVEKNKGILFNLKNNIPVSEINQYVCSKCGYIEFYAKEVDMFK